MRKRLLSDSELHRQSADSMEYLYNDGRASKTDVLAWVRASSKGSGRIYEPHYRPGGLGDRLSLRRREDAENKLFAKNRFRHVKRRDPSRYQSRSVARKTFYSGELKIEVRLVEGEHAEPVKRLRQVHGCPHNAVYRTTISMRGKGSQHKVQHICAPQHITHALDSVKEMRRAAQAALAFAESEGWPVNDHAAYGKDGWHVASALKNAWGGYRGKPGRDPSMYSGPTRNYEYIVYRDTRVSGEGIKIPGTGFKKAHLEAAKKVAKDLGPGSGIYSVSKGRFIGWITFNGYYSPIGRGR